MYKSLSIYSQKFGVSSDMFPVNNIYFPKKWAQWAFVKINCDLNNMLINVTHISMVTYIEYKFLLSFIVIISYFIMNNFTFTDDFIIPDKILL